MESPKPKSFEELKREQVLQDAQTSSTGDLFKETIRFLLQHHVESNPHSAAAHKAKQLLTLLGLDPAPSGLRDVSTVTSFLHPILSGSKPCFLRIPGKLPPTIDEEKDAAKTGTPIFYTPPAEAFHVEPAADHVDESV
jgi:hypothetical protein